MGKPIKPTREQFDIAIDWLGYNEGEDGESDACKAVAKYLEFQVLSSDIRSVARRSGVHKSCQSVSLAC